VAYFVRAVTMPRSLAGVKNGQIPRSSMVEVAGGGDLIREAARAWNALVATMRSETGIRLTYTGTYRSLTSQVHALFSRASTTRPSGSTWSRMYNGRRYYGRPGTAPVASPGTSNHGWGLAIDVAEGGYTPSTWRGVGGAALRWLQNNAESFGFSWEGALSGSNFEPWHLRYFRGDFIPQRVLDYERGVLPPPKPPVVTPPPPPPPPAPGDSDVAKVKFIREKGYPAVFKSTDLDTLDWVQDERELNGAIWWAKQLGIFVAPVVATPDNPDIEEVGVGSLYVFGTLRGPVPPAGTYGTPLERMR
jgi:hypothetical protein